MPPAPPLPKRNPAGPPAPARPAGRAPPPPPALPGFPIRAFTAVDEQKAAVRAVRPRRSAVVAVADQGTPEQCPGGPVDQVEQRLQGAGVGGFCGGVRLRAAEQGLHKLFVKRRGLGTERLIGLTVGAEE